MVQYKKNKGFAQIPIIIGLLFMAIALPAITKLTQKGQDNRSSAAIPDVPCKICSNHKCVASGTACNNNVNECSSDANCAPEISCKTECGLSAYNIKDDAGNIIKSCPATAACTPNEEPTNTPTPTATPTKDPDGGVTYWYYPDMSSRSCVKYPSTDWTSPCYVGDCVATLDACQKIINAPTSTPTPTPTKAPTFYKCSPGSYTCSQTSYTLLEDCEYANGTFTQECYSSMSACQSSCKAPPANSRYAVTSCDPATGKNTCHASTNGAYASQKECEDAGTCKVKDTPTPTPTKAPAKITFYKCDAGSYTCSQGQYSLLEDCEYENGTYTRDCYQNMTECQTKCKAPPANSRYAVTSCDPATGKNTCHASTNGAYASQKECEDAGTCKIDVGPACTPCSNNANARKTGRFSCTSSKADMNDFAIWKSEFVGGGRTIKRNVWKADANCDGYVNLADFAIWLENKLK